MNEDEEYICPGCGNKNTLVCGKPTVGMNRLMYVKCDVCGRFRGMTAPMKKDLQPYYDILIKQFFDENDKRSYLCDGSDKCYW